MSETLDLEPVKITYRRMKWTQDGAIWRCGPVEVYQFRTDGDIRFGTFLDGKLICRSYGYHTPQGAMFAAPHLGPIVKMRKETP